MCSAPDALAASAWSPSANTATVTCFPRLFGKVTAPLTTWSDLFGSTPSLIEISTDSSNFSDFTDCIISIASLIE